MSRRHPDKHPIRRWIDSRSPNCSLSTMQATLPILVSHPPLDPEQGDLAVTRQARFAHVANTQLPSPLRREDGRCNHPLAFARQEMVGNIDKSWPAWRRSAPDGRLSTIPPAPLLHPILSACCQPLSLLPPNIDSPMVKIGKIPETWGQPPGCQGQCSPLISELVMPSSSC